MKKMKTNTIALIAIIAAIAIGILLFLNYAPQGTQAQLTDVSGVDLGNFITYRDVSGFEIDYPYSFKAQAVNDFVAFKVAGTRLEFGTPEDVKADIAQIAPIHGRVVPMSEFLKLVGKTE